MKHLITIPISSVLFMSMLLFSCDENANYPVAEIENLAIDIQPFDPVTSQAGDVVFSPALFKPFTEFGNDVDFGGVVKNNPAFEFLVDPDADVLAIADGEVGAIDFQASSSDYEIVVHSRDFTVYYDHVLNPSISSSDIISAGQTIGNPGNWSGGLGRIEIQINDADQNISLCPFTLFNQATVDSYRDKIDQLMMEWEIYKGDPGIYDDGAFADSGCKTISTIP